MHVNAVGLGVSSDEEIGAYAKTTGAVIVSKDGDFAGLSRRGYPDVQVIWIRLGNTRNAVLWDVLALHLSEIEVALASGEQLIEIS